jgi:hypothetical protein
MNSIQVRGTTHLTNLTSYVCVDLSLAHISHNFVCNGASFHEASRYGLYAKGLNIGGYLLMSATEQDGIPRNFMAKNGVCLEGAVTGGIIATGAVLDCPRGYALNAGGITSSSHVFLDGVHATGLVSFVGAKIEGQLSLNGAQLSNEDDLALSTYQATITGGIWLQVQQVDGVANPFRADGSVSFAGTVAREISGASAIFHCPGGSALNADYLTSASSVRLDGIHATGLVSFVGAKIEGQLGLSGAKVVNSGGIALTANRAIIRGGVFLLPTQRGGEEHPFSAEGRVSLWGAKVSSFVANEAEFLNPNEPALYLSGIEIEGSLELARTRVVGEINLIDATINGMLLERATLKNPGGATIRGHRLRSSGRIVLDAVTSVGRINLTNLSLFGDLSLNGATLEQSNREEPIDPAVERVPDLVGAFCSQAPEALLVFELAKIEGSIHLDKVSIVGDTIWHRATIDGDLLLREIVLLGSIYAFAGSHLVVNGRLTLADVTWGGRARISLRLARVHELNDKYGSWPTELGSIDIVGFQYDHFADSSLKSPPLWRRIFGLETEDSGWNWKHRLQWIRTQTGQKYSDLRTPGEYSPSPYFQLASVYRGVGKDHERRRILEAQQRDLRRFGELGFAAKIWNWLVGSLTGYGYALWRSVLAIMSVYLLSALVVSGVKSHDGFIPIGNTAIQAKQSIHGFDSNTCVADYPCLSTWLYPVDAALPIITFHQSDFWTFKSSSGWGEYGEITFDMMMLLGWGFSTLLVAAGSGLIKQS